MNKYAALANWYFIGGVHAVNEYIKATPIPAYRDHFDGIDSATIDSSDPVRVKMIDDLSVEINQVLAGNFSPHDLIEIIRNAVKIFYGKELDNQYILDTFKGSEFQMQFEFRY